METMVVRKSQKNFVKKRKQSKATQYNRSKTVFDGSNSMSTSCQVSWIFRSWQSLASLSPFQRVWRYGSHDAGRIDRLIDQLYQLCNRLQQYQVMHVINVNNSKDQDCDELGRFANRHHIWLNGVVLLLLYVSSTTPTTIKHFSLPYMFASILPNLREEDFSNAIPGKVSRTTTQKITTTTKMKHPVKDFHLLKDFIQMIDLKNENYRTQVARDLQVEKFMKFTKKCSRLEKFTLNIHHNLFINIKGSDMIFAQNLREIYMNESNILPANMSILLDLNTNEHPNIFLFHQCRNIGTGFDQKC